jgi:hypothetical protein
MDSRPQGVYPLVLAVLHQCSRALERRPADRLADRICRSEVLVADRRFAVDHSLGG